MVLQRSGKGGSNVTFTRTDRASGPELERWPWDADPFKRMSRSRIRAVLLEEFGARLGRETTDPLFHHLLDEMASLHQMRMLARRCIREAEAAGLGTDRLALDLDGEDAHIALRQTCALLLGSTKDMLEWISKNASEAPAQPARNRFRVIK